MNSENYTNSDLKMQESGYHLQGYDFEKVIERNKWENKLLEVIGYYSNKAYIEFEDSSDSDSYYGK